jgi:hypothetical protein
MPINVIKEIIFRSINAYLRHPGHVLLPDNMLSPEEINTAKDDPLVRVNLLLEYWHGSRTLPCKEHLIVSAVLPQFCTTQTMP